MIRGVMLPAAKPGIVAGVILGFGRAVGEAIAVTQVIGGASVTQLVALQHRRHAREPDRCEFQSATSNIESASLLYLGAILLVVSLIVNLLAQLVIRRGAEGGRKRRPRIGFSLWISSGGG